MGCRAEIFLLSLEDIWNVFLWVSIDEWEPGALDMDHDFVSTAEGMTQIVEFELDAGRFVGVHCDRFGEAVTEAASKYSCANQLVSA